MKLPTFIAPSTTIGTSAETVFPLASQTVSRSVYAPLRRSVGSSIPRTPLVTGDVPSTNAVNVVSPEACSASSYLRKWASVAVPRTCVSPVTVPPPAGAVMIAEGGVLSPGLRAATVRRAVALRPLADAVTVVVPAVAAWATPAASTVATADWDEVQAT